MPFTSINIGTCTVLEGRMVAEEILNKLIEGTGSLHRTSIFPCVIFKYKKGINDKPGTPNYDLFRLALKSTAKRLYPNYFNCDWSNQISAVKSDRDMRRKVIRKLPMSAYDRLLDKIKSHKYDDIVKKLKLYVDTNDIVCVDDTEDILEEGSTMGCRTWNGYDINYEDVFVKNLYSFIKTGELANELYLSGAQKDGRGNVAPVTIILPKIAMLAKIESENDKNASAVDIFMDKLSIALEDAKDMLIERNNRIKSQSPKAATFTYENRALVAYDGNPDSVESAILSGTLAIGQIGLAETLQILIGCDQTTDEGMKLAKEIEYVFNDTCSRYKREYSLNFCVYYTPAENLCYTAMSKFKDEFGVIPKVSDKDYFTNSIHVPVWEEVNVFEKIDIESELTGYSNAGCITYVELDDEVDNNIDALEKLVTYAMDKDIPYFAINIPNDTCLDCGYLGNITEDECPQCGSRDIQRLKRVTGLFAKKMP